MRLMWYCNDVRFTTSILVPTAEFMTDDTSRDWFLYCHKTRADKNGHCLVVLESIRQAWIWSRMFCDYTDYGVLHLKMKKLGSPDLMSCYFCYFVNVVFIGVEFWKMQLHLRKLGNSGLENWPESMKWGRGYMWYFIDSDGPKDWQY